MKNNNLLYYYMGKKFVHRSRMSKKQLDCYCNGKTFTHKPEIEDDESNIPVEMEFHNMKTLNKVRNMQVKGKGVRLSPASFVDIRSHNGRGFFDSIKSAFSNPIVKGITDAVAPKLINIAADQVGKQIEQRTGNKEFANIGKDLTKGGLNVGLKALTTQQEQMPQNTQGGRVRRMASKIDEMSFGRGITGYQRGGGVTGYQRRGGGMDDITDMNRIQGLELDFMPESDANLTPAQIRMAHVRSFRKK